jgi:hypothetical protein
LGSIITLFPLGGPVKVSYLRYKKAIRKQIGVNPTII